MIVERKDITNVLVDLRSASKKIVFTNGCFDILHAGHVTYLQQARALGDALFLGLNSDASVKRLGKGEDRPVQSQKDRALILNSLRAVDFLSIFDEDTPLELIKVVNPNILVKGGDWAVEKIVGHDWVTTHGGSVQSLPFVPGQSTTGIIQKIRTL